MFDALSKGFRAAKNRLSGVTELTEDNVDQALRDVRLSLLEADVEFNVVKRFLASVKEKAVGEALKNTATIQGKKVKVGASELFIKICQDELVALMQAPGELLNYAPTPAVTGIMMVGLQGAGKTTTAGKLARFIEKQGRRPLLVAADMQRPGAVEQLQVLGERLSIPVFALADQKPIEICFRAQAEARKLKCDTIIYDTAGRLAIDAELMRELVDIKARVRPQNILLVLDAMIGQDSVKTAATFNDQLQITGVALTKLDGDARGGAALSVKEVTGAPIRFAGMGEALDRLEEFRPEGMASRILGFGDIVGLMKDFEEVVDEEKAERDAKRMLQGQFTFDDFLEQLGTLRQMGPLQDMLEKLPFFSESMPQGFSVDEKELDRIKAIVSSMTKLERKVPTLFQKQPNRIKRVAKGSGCTPKEVADLLQRFSFMQGLMGQIGQQAGLLNRLPGMKQMAMANKLRDAVKTGGLEYNPMMANLADSLLEAAVAGGPGMPGMPGQKGAPGVRTVKVDANKRKAIRKAQKKARKEIAPLSIFTGMKTAVLLGVLVLVGISVGCVQKQKRLSAAEREAATTIASRTPPKPSHPLDIRFEDKVRLIGYDVSAEKLKPGQTFTVTWYWQVDKPLGQGWQLFTHLADASQNRMNLDAVRALRAYYPEPQWKKGDFIKDTQEITFANDWLSNSALFYLGFWNGPHRLHVTTGAKDAQNRALALTLPVEPGQAALPSTALPRLVARHTTGAIALDGKLDDADWKMAQPSGPFVQTMTGAKGSFAASARVIYDADNLYVGYDVVDDYLKCTFTKNDQHLWEQDVVEIMVDPDGDGKNYFELQASPTGLTFDTRYDARRVPQPFGDMAWTSGVVAKVALRGKVNDDESDDGYSVELAIPWRAFAAGKTPAAPPAPGDTWRMNFFAMDAREKGQRAVGWSAPLVGDFHTLDRFGRVIFPQQP